MSRLSDAHGALQRGRNELHEVSREARRRAVQLEIAGGGGSAATRREMELIAADGGLYRDAFSASGVAVGGFSRAKGFVGSMPVVTARSAWGVVGKAGKLFSLGNTVLDGRWSDNRALKPLWEATGSKLVKTVTAPLSVFDAVDSTVGAYRDSHARTSWGRATETLLVGGGNVAALGGPGDTIDFVTGGILSNAGTPITILGEGLLTGDTSGFDDFSGSALDGQYGFGFQNVARVGDWLGTDVIGSLIYGD